MGEEEGGKRRARRLRAPLLRVPPTPGAAPSKLPPPGPTTPGNEDLERRVVLRTSQDSKETFEQPWWRTTMMTSLGTQPMCRA